MGGVTAAATEVVAPARASQRLRVIDAALSCIARAGTKKTTVDDVAREAEVSRATLYRAFPGGKDAIFAAVVETELARFFSTVAIAMGRAADLEEVLVNGICVSATYLSNHAAIAYLCDHEPDLVLQRLVFGQMDQTLELCSTFAQPFFARFLDPVAAARGAELAVRVIVSYLMSPSPSTNLQSEAEVQALVRAFILPGVEALASSSAVPVAPHV